MVILYLNRRNLNVSSKNLRNSGWSIVNILLYPIAFMGLTPVFIHAMGEDHFGIWMLVNSYVYIAVNIISFGFSNSITAHVAEALGKQDRGKLHAYINSSTRIMGILAMATVGLALLALAALRLFPSLGALTDGYEPSLGAALVASTLLIAVKFFELLYQSAFKGFERFDLAGGYNILNKFAVLGLQLALVLAGRDLFELMAGSLVINVAVVILQGVAIRRLLPGYRFSAKRNPGESRDLFIFGFWTWVQTIISVAAYQADRFLVAIALGPAVAGFYILASTIANHMHMAFGALASWLFPKVARHKEIAPGEVLTWFHTLRGFTLGISLLAILFMYLIYTPFFTLWIGAEKFRVLGPFFALFLVYETFLVLSIIPQFYLNGVRMLRFVTIVEGMYKTGILIGMFIAYSVEKTGESLLIGQIAALALLMPVEYFMVNRKILYDNPVAETVVTMIPSFCIALIILLNRLPVTLALAPVAAVVYALYYLKPARFNLKLLLS